MLDYLGVPYVQSAGEAEAMCAFLNKNHVSNKLDDSFCFFYIELFSFNMFVVVVDFLILIVIIIITSLHARYTQQ